MAHERITIAAADGDCPTQVLTPPEGAGPWPGVILCMDAGGIRPALVAMAARLAGYGYVVLLPDFFYRYGSYGPFDPKEVFAGDFRVILGPLMATTDFRKAAADARPMLDYLDGRADVAPTCYGVTGYCMGGGVALTIAGTYPDRIAAAASFHGGNLATDADFSPHRLVPAIAAEVYVGAADDDDSYPPAMADRLRAALDQAGVAYRHELYPGAAHGWTQTDFPVYGEAAAERHWDELIALLRRTIG